MDIKKDETVYEIDLFEVLSLLFSRAYIIILCALIGGVLGYWGTKLFVTPMYMASATFYVNNYTGESSSTTITSNDLTASAKLVKTYMAIIKSNSVMNKVVEKVGDTGLTGGQLVSRVSASAIDETEVFKVSVLHESPQMAAQIVNAITQIAPDVIKDIVEGSSVKVIDYPKVPTTVATPNYSKNAILGAMICAFLCAAYILIKYLMDNTIKSTDDLEAWNIPVLASIPDIMASSGKGSRYGYSYGYARAANRKG